MKIKANYHTHNYRCGHATGTVDDYCDEAIKSGLEILGISDHVPFPDDRWHIMEYKGRQLQIRMLVSELDSYSEEVDRAKEKYQQRLKVLKSFECEYLPEFINYYKEELLGRLGCDYLIGSVHYIQVDGEWIDPRRGAVGERELNLYSEHMIKTIESGLFRFIAHPDLIFSNYPTWDNAAINCSRQILECAARNKMPIEVNGQGMRASKVLRDGVKSWPYPVKDFWKLAAEYDLQVIVNSDAHAPELVGDNLENGFGLLRDSGVPVVLEL